MKKLFPIYIIMMLWSAQVFGQFQFGLGGGLSTATIKHVGVDQNPMYRTGVTFSFPIAYQITPKVTVALIPGFSQKGLSFKETNGDNILQLKINYIQLIPEIRYSFFNQFYAGLGMYYGRKERERSKPGADNWINLGMFGVVEDHDIGLTPSISYRIGSVYLSLRYLHGLSNVLNVEFTDMEGDLIPDTKTFNRSFELAAFYVFGI